MKLKKMIISQYKSIRKPIEIDFSQNLLCFVGKNGSGKTNILRAIKQFFSVDQHHNERADYKLIYELNDDEIENFSDEVEFDKEMRIVEVESSYRDFRATRVKAKIHELSISKWENQLRGLKNKIVENFECYYKKLSEITIEELSKKNKTSSRIDIVSATNFYRFERSSDDSKTKMETIVNTLERFMSDNFKKGKINIDYDEVQSLPYIHVPSLRVLSKESLYIDPLLATFTDINYDEYEKTIDRINSELKDYYDNATKALDEFNRIVQKIHRLFNNRLNNYYDEIDKKDKKYKSFLNLIKSSIDYDALYLDNESTLLFQTTNDYYNRRNDGNNVIYKCVSNYLKKNGILQQNEDIKDLSNITDSRKKQLKNQIDKYLATIVPLFDKDRIISLTAIISEDNRSFVYRIKEKNGVDIPLESTSLGRRWYLSYIFLKNSMDKDDIIIIDEPASFLHPDAQKQILMDLIELSKTNKVIYCTNSIDMIPNNLENYYFVDIDDSGSVVKQITISDSISVINEIGINNYKELILNKNITYLLVEGKSDKTLFETYMKIRKVDLSKYFIYSLEGAGNAKILYKFLKDSKTMFKIILDADTKTKFSILDEIDSKQKVLVGGDSEEKSLEGLLHGEDRVKYIRNKKVNENLVRKAIKSTDFTSETLKKLDELFIELGVIDKELRPL